MSKISFSMSNYHFVILDKKYRPYFVIKVRCNDNKVNKRIRNIFRNNVYSYGYIEPFFVLMEVISVSNDLIWLIDVIKWRTVNSAP